MIIQELKGKAVCILGFGQEGRAMLGAIQKYAPSADVTIADRNEKLQETRYKMQTGGKYLENLNRFDVIIISPGIPPQKEFKAVEKKITNSSQIFLDTAKAAGATLIGVTGTKGKSTTASLIHAILVAAGKKSYLVGNIGDPSIAHLDQATKDSFFVMEMSSYQLMHTTTSPQIALITSFFPEHLDYHGTEKAYLEAKKNITRFQSDGDVVFYNGVSDGAYAIAKESEGELVAFDSDESIVGEDEMTLLGLHNLRNAAGAWKVAEYLGVSEAIAADTIKKFQGLPHRLQSLGVHDGIEWIDDAISTTPHSTIEALESFDHGVHTVILGGKDRGLKFENLADEIALHPRNVILLGENREIIRKALESSKKEEELQIFDAVTMEEAVKIAKRVTRSGSRCLLSPASASYDMYKNFEEKGEDFKKQIQVRR
jgi:UDP-N-acetylmuramoylalanine--D-glutamate ligase